MNTDEKLMKEFYYNPSIGATSIKKLYDKVKDKGITQKTVKEFINKQEAHQLFKTKNKKINYFPIYASNKNENFEVDLIDMSDLETSNKHYKYILTCIDVFSRFVHAIALKNKLTSTVVEAMEKIIKHAKPSIITCDQGSEFISQSFKELMKNNDIDIHYVMVGNHNPVVDRFVRTLREKINKYLESHNTTTYK